MSTTRKLIALFTLLLFAGIMKSCAGGSSSTTGTNTTAGSAAFNGTYNCTGSSTTPAGTSSGQGSFSCLNGQCADSARAFTGTIDGNGNFTGTDILCQTCLPLPMSGHFSTTTPFTISGQSGGVSATFTCNYGGGGGGGGGGGTTPTPVITGFGPASELPRHRRDGRRR